MGLWRLNGWHCDRLLPIFWVECRLQPGLMSLMPPPHTHTSRRRAGVCVCASVCVYFHIYVFMCVCCYMTTPIFSCITSENGRTPQRFLSTCEVCVNICHQYGLRWWGRHTASGRAFFKSVPFLDFTALYCCNWNNNLLLEFLIDVDLKVNETRAGQSSQSHQSHVLGIWWDKVKHFTPHQRRQLL